MQDKIKEIMDLVRVLRISAKRDGELGRDSARTSRVFETIESKLRELVREPLTEQEISIVFDTTEDESEYGTYDFGFFKDFTRNIERAHNITNTSN